MASPESPKSRKSSKNSKKSPSSKGPSSSRIRNSSPSKRNSSPSKLNGQRSEESNRKRKSRNSPGIEESSHEKKVKKEVPDREKVRSKDRNGEDRDNKNKDKDRTRKLEGSRNRNKDSGNDRDSRDRNRSNRSRVERSVSGRGENRDREESRGDRVGSRGGGDRNERRRSGVRSERGSSRGGRGRGSRPDWDDEKPGPSVQEAWGGKDVKDDKKGETKQEKPNYELSGVLQEEDAVHGVQVKYTEPSDGRVPEKKWRLYVFKDAKQQDVFRIHRLSAYLIGKERRVCDIPMHHPSISKQHAVLQYRQKPAYTEDGQLQKLVIKPYIIDLGSTNGTFLNGTQVEPLRYYELLEKDVLKFGFSSREYVLLHASSLPGEASPDNDAEVDSKLKDVTKKSGDHV